jgi:signal transduction histidine kinase
MLGYHPVSGGIKFRLVAFTLAIAGMVWLIAYAAQSAWGRASELRERLTSVQLQSFQIANHIQETIRELDNAILRFGAYHDSGDWSRFEKLSEELDKWIDDERPLLFTEKEKLVLDLINTNYDDYLAAASAIERKMRTQPQHISHLADFADFESQSQSLLNLGSQLAKAHLESMDSFLADSNESLAYLRALLMGSLVLLLLAGGGLAVIVYRELIAPLRLKLIESQALVERHEKLASLGMLAAGVAHEIRNPLTAIKAWLFIQQKHLQPGSPEHKDSAIISNEIGRLENIVKDVLLFARPSDPQLSTVSAGEPLRQVQTLLAPQLAKANVALAVEDCVSASIRVDREQIQQVLINLIQNAADSIGHDGAVTLRARLDTKRLADRSTEVVILEVADTGKGMSPEVQKRLFDPFFSTKESGTGLGLPIAARIVEKHGGALQYQTQPDHGTTFGIVLPRAP